jgi:hypothetical protein
VDQDAGDNDGNSTLMQIQTGALRP